MSTQEQQKSNSWTPDGPNKERASMSSQKKDPYWNAEATEI